MGVPGSGKTTASRTVAQFFEVPYLHSSDIAKRECPGDWVEQGAMAPEPCTTLAVERAIDATPEWVLDGFPRSEFQLRSVRREAIVYLDVSTKAALRRVKTRGRHPPAFEERRITEQTRLLAPVKAQAAVIIPTTFRDPTEVAEAIIRWYLDDIHPSEFGSKAR